MALNVLTAESLVLHVDFFPFFAAFQFEFAFVVVRESVAAADRVKLLRAPRTLARWKT